MNQNSPWKWFLVAFVLFFSLWEMYPPQNRNLVEEFADSAAFRDTNFTALVTRARDLEKAQPHRSFNNLIEAIGTNDITRYFPAFKLPQNEPRPTRAILNRLQRQAAGKIKLGLDLQGGTAFVVRLQNPETAPGDTNAPAEAIDRSLMVDQAIEVLRRRVDAFGVAEPIIQPAGADQILIQLPGLSEADIQTARTTIEKAAFLEFRLVHPESDQLVSQGLKPPGYDRLTMRRKAEDGKQESVQVVLVKRGAEQGLIGKFVSQAAVTRDPMSNRPEIILRFDSQGAELFADITRKSVGRPLAIVLDGELYSAPVIQQAITGGSASISGDFTLKEALELSHILENPLEAPLSIEEQRGVDPSLGKDSIRSGVVASIAAALLTFSFMAAFYFLAGLVANVALLMNVIILMGVMCSIDATLTMPGIAGIALTIGMAVDANVLIFERIREEMAKGKGLRSALSAGYDRAFGTILDSHVTTLITSIILIAFGTGPIRGFGVTLTIGVGASLFTALTVTRMIFNVMLARKMIQSLKMMPIVKFPAINFLGGSKIAAVASVVVILIGTGYGVFVRGEKMLGVDFSGGDGSTFRFEQKIEVDRIREALRTLNVGDPQIQPQRSVIDNRETLNIVSAYGTGPIVEAALKEKFPEAKYQLVGIDKVGPTVGRNIQKSALISSLLAFFGILVYVAFRYEFGFAVAAVVAVVHDVLVTMGIFFLVGGELTSPMVAAVLTIIGYSINDKIVILDRIREDLKLGVRGSFRDVINLALNQTLSRTLITGGSVILATLSLYLLGGGIINDFAFTFLVGTLVGTYSSVYIAAPLVLRWYKGERPSLAANVIPDQTVPARA